MNIFSELLDDPDDRVRIEAPEIFRVLGKRKPELALPYLEKLLRSFRSRSFNIIY